MFPIETEGPHKGKYIPRKDARGNAIIDPTTLIQSQTCSIDYNVYKACVDMNKSVESVAKEVAFSAKELEEIDELFAPP